MTKPLYYIKLRAGDPPKSTQSIAYILDGNTFIEKPYEPIVQELECLWCVALNPHRYPDLWTDPERELMGYYSDPDILYKKRIFLPVDVRWMLYKRQAYSPLESDREIIEYYANVFTIAGNLHNQIVDNPDRLIGADSLADAILTGQGMLVEVVRTPLQRKRLIKDFYKHNPDIHKGDIYNFLIDNGITVSERTIQKDLSSLGILLKRGRPSSSH